MRKFTESVSAIREAKVLALKEKEQAEYAKFFSDKLKKYGVGSPNELSDEEKKKFFEEVDKEWKGTNESKTEETFSHLDGKVKLKYDGKGSVDVYYNDKFVIHTDANNKKSDIERAKGFVEDFGKLDENLELLEEGSELQDAYAEYFKAHMDDHDIKSPSELSDEEKSAFFDKIKSGWVKGKGPKAIKESKDDLDSLGLKLVNNLEYKDSKFTYYYDINKDEICLLAKFKKDKENVTGSDLNLISKELKEIGLKGTFGTDSKGNDSINVSAQDVRELKESEEVNEANTIQYPDTFDVQSFCTYMTRKLEKFDAYVFKNDNNTITCETRPGRTLEQTIKTTAKQFGVDVEVKRRAHESDDEYTITVIKMVKESEEVNEAIDPKIEGAYDDIFFIWDEFTDDEREGIEGGVTNGKRTLFMTNPPQKFIKKVKELLDKEGIKHKFTTIGSNQSKLTLESLIKEGEEVNEAKESHNPLKISDLPIGTKIKWKDGSISTVKKPGMRSGADRLKSDEVYLSDGPGTMGYDCSIDFLNSEGVTIVNESEIIKYITFSKPLKHNLIQILEMVSDIDVNPYVTVNDISFKFKNGGMTVAIEETESTEVAKFVSIIEKVLDVKMLETENKPVVSLNEGISIFEYINTLDISDVDKLRLIEHTSKCYPIPTAPDMIYWEVCRRAAELGIERF